MISASCWRKWIHKSEAALLFDPAPAPRLMLGVLSSHTLAKTPSEDRSSVRSVEMATFFFALRFRNKKCLFEQYLSGEKDIQSSRGFNQE